MVTALGVELVLKIDRERATVFIAWMFFLMGTAALYRVCSTGLR